MILPLQTIESIKKEKLYDYLKQLENEYDKLVTILEGIFSLIEEPNYFIDFIWISDRQKKLLLEIYNHDNKLLLSDEIKRLIDSLSFYSNRVNSEFTNHNIFLTVGFGDITQDSKITQLALNKYRCTIKYQ